MAAITLSVQSLRSLKYALLDRFPTVASSHMSEALAFSLGFRTHAALLAKVAQCAPHSMFAIDEQLFVERLHQLGYPGIRSVPFDELVNNVPDQFRKLVQRLLKLEERPEGHWDEINGLRQRCASLFAAAFGIGMPESREDDDKKLVKRLREPLNKSVSNGFRCCS